MLKRIIIFSLFIAGFLFAETIGSDSVKYHFNPVVVTATKIAGAQKDIAASITVLGAEEIKNTSAQSVIELVQNHIPSVSITERGVMGYGVANGAAGGISIRGVGGSPVTGVLVLRDGRPDMMGMMGHAIPDAYSTQGVERVEVVRGPASFLYGTNAMGGVINIVSEKMQYDGFKTEITGGLGSFSSQRLGLTHGGKMGAFDYLVTAQTKNTDGHRDYSTYEGDFYTAHLGYKLSESTQIQLNANLSNINMDDPGPEAESFQRHWYDLQRTGADLSVDHSSGLGETTLRLHVNSGTHKIYDGWRSTDYTFGFMGYHNFFPFQGNQSTVGFDVKQYGGDASESLNQIPVIDYSKHQILEYAPYFHTQQMFLGRFIASAGVRLENHEIYGTEVLPKAGLVAHATSSTSLRLSAAKGFRSPTIREMYIFPPKNGELLPEEMWNYEFGVTQNFGANLKVDASVYQSVGENMIRLVLPPPPPAQWQNTGEFTHTGYELSVNWLATEKMLVSAGYSQMDRGDETMNTPGSKITAYASYDFGIVNLSANLIHAQDLYGADFSKMPMPDYTLLNLNADFQPWDMIGCSVSVKNVLDEEYQTLYGYPMPGRTLMFDVNYNF